MKSINISKELIPFNDYYRYAVLDAVLVKIIGEDYNKSNEVPVDMSFILTINGNFYYG